MDTETRDRLEAAYDSTMDTLRHLCAMLERPLPGEEGFVVPEVPEPDPMPAGRREELSAAIDRRTRDKQAERYARLGVDPPE